MNLNHNLILDNTDVDDSGQYICHAELDDEMIEQSISVTVVPGTNIHMYIRSNDILGVFNFIYVHQLIATLTHYPCTVALPGLSNWCAFLEQVLATM